LGRRLWSRLPRERPGLPQTCLGVREERPQVGAHGFVRGRDRGRLERLAQGLVLRLAKLVRPARHSPSDAPEGERCGGSELRVVASGHGGERSDGRARFAEPGRRTDRPEPLRSSPLSDPAQDLLVAERLGLPRQLQGVGGRPRPGPLAARRRSDEERNRHEDSHGPSMPRLNRRGERDTTAPMNQPTLPLALAVAFSIGAAPVAAQRLRLADAAQMLDSSDRDEVRMGIEGLGSLGGRRAAAALTARIRRGLPADLLDVAVETLGLLGEASAGPVLFELANHRRPEVRRAAIEAIVSCRPRGASAALIGALDDLDPRVRASAAVGLGQIGDTNALEVLFQALDRGLLEAATAIGQLADEPALRRLVGYLGRIPFDALAPALTEVFARRDVSREVKLDLVGRVAELATPEAREYLTELAEALGDGPLQQAAEEAARGIVEGG